MGLEAPSDIWRRSKLAMSRSFGILFITQHRQTCAEGPEPHGDITNLQCQIASVSLWKWSQTLILPQLAISVAQIEFLLHVGNISVLL